MSLLWLLLFLLVVIVAVFTLVDVFTRHYSAGKTAAWAIIVVVVPVIGPVVYWLIRPTPESEVEEARLARAEMRRESERRPFG